MALTKEQLAKRGEIGASDVPTIVNGTAEQLNAKWRQLTGLVEPEDLSQNWAVQQGSYMEPFILDWHARKLGYALERRGEVLRHPVLDYLTCTLDCFDATRNAVIDSKCTAWSIDWARQFYTPQLLVQRQCADADLAIMLISVGGREPGSRDQFDADYYRQVLERVSAFKLCMETMTEPSPLPQLVAPEKWRTIDLVTDETPNWRDEMIGHLMMWDETRDAAKAHAVAADDAKKLVPMDVGKILCDNIIIKRNKKGFLAIRSTGDE
jgi:hypothetical protein